MPVCISLLSLLDFFLLVVHHRHHHHDHHHLVFSYSFPLFFVVVVSPLGFTAYLCFLGDVHSDLFFVTFFGQNPINIVMLNLVQVAGGVSGRSPGRAGSVTILYDP